jgi:hypothetical protein
MAESREKTRRLRNFLLVWVAVVGAIGAVMHLNGAYEVEPPERLEPARHDVTRDDQ